MNTGGVPLTCCGRTIVIGTDSPSCSIVRFDTSMPDRSTFTPLCASTST
jgi:hypothetical protein